MSGQVKISYLTPEELEKLRKERPPTKPLQTKFVSQRDWEWPKARKIREQKAASRSEREAE